MHRATAKKKLLNKNKIKSISTNMPNRIDTATANIDTHHKQCLNQTSSKVNININSQPNCLVSALFTKDNIKTNINHVVAIHSINSTTNGDGTNQKLTDSSSLTSNLNLKHKSNLKKKKSKNRKRKEIIRSSNHLTPKNKIRFILVNWDDSRGSPGFWYIGKVTKWKKGKKPRPIQFVDTGGKNAEKNKQPIDSQYIHFWKVCIYILYNNINYSRTLLYSMSI